VHHACQVPQDAKGTNVGIGNVEVRVEQVLANIKALVPAEGGAMADIFRISIFVSDRANLPATEAPRRRCLSQPYQVANVLVVSGLAYPGLASRDRGDRMHRRGVAVRRVRHQEATRP
jgi:enamine deaminase RidA (YjgF/YER057c/UK114 family)